MRARRSGRVLAAVASAAGLVIALSACVGDASDTATPDPGTSESASVADDEPTSESTGSDDDKQRESSGDDESEAGDKQRERGAGKQREREPEAPDRPRGKLFTVTEVVDGDTVHLDKPGETSVRIIGIETPETVHPSEPVECGGPAASRAAEELLAGRQVRLVHDPTQGRTDAYGRVLGYIDVPGSGDYGLSMIERGFAAEYTYDSDYRRQQRYRAAERRAQDASDGVWGKCGGVDTPLEQPSAEPEPETEAPPTADSGAGCASGYSPCVPSYPPDLDCADVDGPITITGDDPHGFDADGDGIGCDS